MSGAKFQSVNIAGVELGLCSPDTTRQQWIGQTEILEQLLACWLVVDDADFPLTPRITGLPGMGKTTLAMSAAAQRKQDLYIQQCTADTRPEDLLVTPVLAANGKIRYQASPLVTAMIRGAICVLDEGNRMNEKSWASLAPLLDHRRYVESVIAGVTIPASRDFRCCVTMNEDESTYEIPDYILSRLQPTLQIGFPNREDEMAILKYHLPFADMEILGLTAQFLQRSHDLRLDFSPRDGLHIIQFAIKRLAQNPNHPLGKDAVWREALLKVLGDEAQDLDRLAEQRQRMMGSTLPPQGLEDFFFDNADELRPDRDDEESDSEG